MRLCTTITLMFFASFPSLCQSVTQGDVEKSIFQLGVLLPDQTATFSSQGTAFSVSSDGLVATVFHVYAGAIKSVADLRGGTIVVRRSGRESGKWVASPFEIVNGDPKHDLILLKLQNYSPDNWKAVGGIIPLKLADAASLTLPHVAQMVGYIGQDVFPVHLRSDIAGTTFVTIGPENVEEFLLSAELLPGHSGSPILTENGEVVGVASSIVPISLPFNPQPVHAGLARAVKVEHLKRMLPEKKSK